MRILLVVLLMATAVAARTEDAGAMRERLVACAACHGAEGEGMRGAEYYPHLAGKPAGYLLDQLRAFRDGRRAYGEMNWLMRNMDDAYLERIAAHFAAMPPRTRAGEPALEVDPALADRARALVERGDAARGVPACAACHGEPLTGLEPGVPALVGLPADYVIAQIGAWRAGVRTARGPDCMAQIARALDPRDVRALATYLAARGTDAPAPPARAGSFVPPRACGDLPHAEDAR